ncbi:hypothetical protein EVAR_54223_1 [Eumeta japonica]|uniref:Uncharacterized protein n=1 Tax=Eumeta variegata TaxID=151549 RepID=A0A4C1YXG5_EUMVA|nr:hypothetical protein EVAR_54223_1 [Eumeta japonica]
MVSPPKSRETDIKVKARVLSTRAQLARLRARETERERESERDRHTHRYVGMYFRSSFWVATREANERYDCSLGTLSMSDTSWTNYSTSRERARSAASRSGAARGRTDVGSERDRYRAERQSKTNEKSLRSNPIVNRAERVSNGVHVPEDIVGRPPTR